MNLNADMVDGYHASAFLFRSGGTMLGSITMNDNTRIWGTNVIDSLVIRTDAVTSGKIKDGEVGTDDLAGDAVTSGKIKDGEVGTDDLADGAVTSGKIKNGEVAEGDLATDAVTSGKIKNGEVAEGDLATDAVTSGKIKDGEVKSDDLAGNAVTSAKINDGTIADADIAANANIAGSKINPVFDRLTVNGDILMSGGNSLKSDGGDGSLRLNAPGSAYLFIDNDNNSAGESFGVYHNNASHNQPLETLFTINEAGTAYINGNFGIGITPHEQAKLDVNGHAAIREALAVGWNPPTPLDPYYYEDLYRGIRLGVNGNVYVWGKVYVDEVQVHSDDRLKFNELKLENGLAKVMALEPKRYDRAEYEYDPENEELLIYAGKTRNEIGLVAQEVQKIIPEAVDVPEDENSRLWSISYDMIIPVLIKAIQEQQAQIEELKQEIQAMKSGI